MRLIRILTCESPFVVAHEVLWRARRQWNKLTRESPFVVTREVLWRARRQWNKRRMLGRIERFGQVTFRSVPYYSREPRTISEPSRALIISFAEEIRAGRYPFLGYGTANLGRRPKWNLDFVSGAEWPYVRWGSRECIRLDGSDVKTPLELSRLQFLPVLGKAHVLRATTRIVKRQRISCRIGFSRIPLPWE